MNKLTHFFLLITILVVTSAVPDELLSVQILFRHGDRTPIWSYPNDPYNKILFAEAEPGQLTAAGKRRQYALGHWLRQRYSTFLPEKYSYEDITVVCSDVDRTHMSAAANLAGLYPPVDGEVWNKEIPWQPIPIHVNIPVLESDPSNCPRYNDLVKRRNDGEEFAALNAQYTEVFDELTQYSGKNVTNIIQSFSIRDVLYIEDVKNYELPQWTQQFYPSPLNEMAAKVFRLDTFDEDLKTLVAGPFLNELLVNFENVNKKLIMYSAHDSVVVNIIATLVPDYPEFCPEFATVAIFELWQGTKNKYIKLTLKREDNGEILVVKGCKEKCLLEKFKKLVNPYAISVAEKKVLCNTPL